MGFPKPRSNVSNQRAHAGQAASAPRKRANQRKKAEQLLAAANYHGVSLCELNAIRAAERNRAIKEGKEIAAQTNMARHRMQGYW